MLYRVVAKPVGAGDLVEIPDIVVAQRSANIVTRGTSGQITVVYLEPVPAGPAWNTKAPDPAGSTRYV